MAAHSDLRFTFTAGTGAFNVVDKALWKRTFTDLTCAKDCS